MIEKIVYENKILVIIDSYVIRINGRTSNGGGRISKSVCHNEVEGRL